VLDWLLAADWSDCGRLDWLLADVLPVCAPVWLLTDPLWLLVAG
jgi:hypothetical protein